MKKLILIKLGGSVITDKKKFKTPREGTIFRLSEEIANARKIVGKNTLFIITTGGGSYSHPVATRYEVQKGFINEKSLEGFALTADAEVQINQLVMKYLLSVHLPVISFGPRSFVLGRNGRVKNVFVDSILEALYKGVLPVVYGDMLVDESRGCMTFSGEQVITLLAEKLKSNFGKITIINCSKTNGVYDNTGKTIPLINRKNFNIIKRFISGSDGIDVTGGMIHKVRESLDFAKKHQVITIVINGNKKDCLYKAILGKKVKSTIISDD